MKSTNNNNTRAVITSADPQLIRSFRGHQDLITSVALNPDM